MGHLSNVDTIYSVCEDVCRFYVDTSFYTKDLKILGVFFLIGKNLYHLEILDTFVS